MMVSKTKFFLVTMASFCLASSCDTGCGDPVSAVEGVVKNMLMDLGQKCQSDSRKQSYESVVLEQFIPSVDSELITKQVLGRRYWESTTDEDKKQLQSLLEQLLAKQYADAFSCAYIEKEMKFYPVRGEVKKYSRVESSFVLDEKNMVMLKYNVRCSNGNWLIYDIVIDGLSLGQTYRSQFNRVLQQGGAPALINYLDHQLNKVVDEV